VPTFIVLRDIPKMSPASKPTPTKPGVFRRIGRFFVWLVKEKHGLLLACFTSCLILYTVFDQFSMDLEQSGDLTYHLAVEAQVAQALEEGRSPLGPISINFGTPVLKFYQPLWYLVNAPLTVYLGLDALLVHNLVISFFFILTPFAILFGYRALGLSELAAGLAAMLTLLAVSGFGNSYEAFFATGVIGQLLGAVFFPLFLGSFSLLLKGRRGPLGAAALFALAFVAHAMMAVYAFLAGCLLFLTNKWDLRRIWLRLLAFSLLACLLVSFWLVPFVAHRERFRPVPDVVAQPHTAHFSTGFTVGEAARLLLSGRLLDDARTARGDGQNADDKLVDKMNMMRTLTVRPPVITWLALAGLVLCLLKVRSTPHRYLVAGFALSFLFLMGPDDVPWLHYLPFAKRIQFFRATYLLDFFAFGLAGAGIHIAVSFLAKHAAKLPRAARWAAATVGGLVGLAGVIYYTALVLDLAEKQVTVEPTDRFEQAHVVAQPAYSGLPLRMILDHGHFRSDKRRMSFLAYRKMRAVCGHWRGLGPTITGDVCRHLFHAGKNVGAARKHGIGYYLVNRKRAGELNEVEHPAGQRIMRQLKRGRGHYLYQDVDAQYLWPAPRPVLTVADDAQWFHVARAWVGTLRNQKRTAPTPVRAPPDATLDAIDLTAFEAVWVLEGSLLSEAGRAALASHVAAGGKVLTTGAIPGVDALPIAPDKPRLLDSLGHAPDEREVAIAKIAARVGGPFEFRVRASRATVLVLPEVSVFGWRAELDGAPAEVFSAASDLVAAVVPEGEHRLVFYWQTPGWEKLVHAFCVSTWLMLGAGLVIGVLSRRRKRR
jgi:MFS family permease